MSSTVIGPLALAEGVSVDDLHLDLDAPIQVGRHDPGLAVPVVEASGHVHHRDACADPYRPVGAGTGERERVAIRAVPYFAWANRGADAMRVWIPSD